MPRFYFDVASAYGESIDDEGLEFSGAAEARHEALKALGSITREEMLADGERDLSIKVRGEGGEVVFEATLSLRIDKEIFHSGQPHVGSEP